MPKKKAIPKLASEAEERKFWGKADSTQYLDWSNARPASLPNLRPTLKTISLRLPVSLIAELKILANKRDVPYQSLLKTFLADRVRQELGRQQGKRLSGSVHGPRNLSSQKGFSRS